MNVQNQSIEIENEYRPIRRFLAKLYLYVVTIFSGITLGGLLLHFFILTIEFLDEDIPEYRPFISNPENVNLILTWFVILNAIWIIPSIILIPIYVRNIAYTFERSEIVIKKGIITKTEKHIPYRTITNVSARAGIYDRFLGIGTVEIETAGKSGTQWGPEGKLEGISNFNYKAFRDFIVNELKSIKGTYATGTELPTIEPKETDENNQFYEKMLVELKGIKKLLG